METAQTELSPVEQAPTQQREFLVSDLETLRVIADPTRLRILELLVVEAQPVKRLAATLNLPQTKLYYHMNLLEEHGLIKVVGTRVVSGIIEKQYWAVAQSYRICEALLKVNAPDSDDTIELMLTSLLDGVKSDLLRGLSAGTIQLQDNAPDQHKLTLGRVPMRLTPERAAELHKRLGDLIREFGPDPEALPEPAPGTQLYHLFVACFPAHVTDEQPERP